MLLKVIMLSKIKPYLPILILKYILEPCLGKKTKFGLQKKIVDLTKVFSLIIKIIVIITIMEENVIIMN